MSNLLTVFRGRPQSMAKRSKKGGRTAFPLMVEFPVHPDSAPFLVTSSDGLVWVEEAHPGDIVKAAVRTIKSPGELFEEILNAVLKRSESDQWGSVHPYSPDGVKAAIDYLQSYGLNDVEALVPRTQIRDDGTPAALPDWVHPKKLRIPLRPSSWVPRDHIIVIPKNRDFVGLVVYLDRDMVFMVAHNASRGIAVARNKA